MVGAALVLLILLDRIVDVWTDWLWFGEVGYTNVFSGAAAYPDLAVPALRARRSALFVGGNLYLAYRLRPLLRANSPEQHALERYRMLLSPRIGLWITAASAASSASSPGSPAQGALAAVDAVPQRRSRSASRTRSSASTSGFYVFDYPFWRYLLDVGFTATALAVLGALAVHYLYGGVRLQGVGDRMTHRRAGPPDHAGRGLRAAQGGRVLPGPAGAAARATTPAPTCTAPATPTSTRCCRPRRS